MLYKILVIMGWDIPDSDKEKLIKELVNYETSK